MAEAFGVVFGPHHGKSGVGMLANLHMQCAAPNAGSLEYMYDRVEIFATSSCAASSSDNLLVEVPVE